ncbi:multidrug transporter MatE [Paenibacillus swuensis]|uniref:Probable multidrug resistance protein NorM n=1 Tax=Paenibacillus swuensis TaxID=1178515 RepID=A0A172TNA7_9BACL|nr:MATE family efflux transporter [Paenibacillus swuensis]ANE48541.1 multidrug transporter MatE [Paenibacillus swuensis]
MNSNWKRILLLALPSIASFATATVTGTINLIILGQMGALIIAIVGVCNIIMYNAFAIFSGLGHTINYLVAQNYGQNDMKKGIERTNMGLYLALLFGFLIMLAGWVGSDFILELTGGSQKFVETGSDYLRIRFYAMAIGIVVFTFQGFLRGIGRTTTTMILSVSANVVMVVLTYGLAFGHFGLPEMGLVGAAWAILFGELLNLLGCLFVYYILLHKPYNTRVRTRFHTGEAKLILQESGKLGVQEFSMSFSMYIFTVFVMRLGEKAVAANEIALNVMSFGFMPAFAFGATATILVGQEIGNRNPDGAKRAGTDTAILGLLFLLVLGIIEFIFAVPIAKLYAPTEVEVYKLAAYLISVSAFLQLFDGLFNFYAGGLRGIGDTTFLLRTSFLLSIFLFIPLAYVLIFIFDTGSLGAWIALYTYITVYGLAVTIRYYRTDWSSVRITEASHS